MVMMLWTWERILWLKLTKESATVSRKLPRRLETSSLLRNHERILEIQQWYLSCRALQSHPLETSCFGLLHWWIVQIQWSSLKNCSLWEELHLMVQNLMHPWWSCQYNRRANLGNVTSTSVNNQMVMKRFEYIHWWDQRTASFDVPTCGGLFVVFSLMYRLSQSVVQYNLINTFQIRQATHLI